MRLNMRSVLRDNGDSWEREMGFEPTTSTLARLHSTTELFPHWRSFCNLSQTLCRPDLVCQPDPYCQVSPRFYSYRRPSTGGSRDAHQLGNSVAVAQIPRAITTVSTNSTQLVRTGR